MERVVKLLTVADAEVCFWRTSRPTLSGGSGSSCPWDRPSDLCCPRGPVVDLWRVQHLCSLWKEETHSDSMRKTNTVRAFFSLSQRVCGLGCCSEVTVFTIRAAKGFHQPSVTQLQAYCTEPQEKQCSLHLAHNPLEQLLQHPDSTNHYIKWVLKRLAVSSR